MFPRRSIHYTTINLPSPIILQHLKKHIKIDINVTSILISNPDTTKKLYISTILNKDKPSKLGPKDPDYIPYI
ncbi:uncharacterized protein N7506_005313 [Penicillium brevicompactum]|uniref:uncharacterized protein n=1 Tax=Penicillium brevicompactum TaxID=5074 RepID=UPI00254035B0|nr:uncharacterized protein N7506_005313 [Penicillium brevicompactum]KAJ5337291.1 hypothetical protein N7506_005313 [Penicillium brevicompactum]